MKRVITMIFAAVMLCMAAVPALAAPLYPTEAIMLDVGNGYEIRKTYKLMPGDDPEDIDTADFERSGVAYTFVELLKEETEFSGARPHSQTVSVASSTQDMGKVLTLFDAALEVETEDGYTGTLTLDHTTIKVETDGYKASNYTVTATRTYPNLSDADVSLIPKTTEEKDKTLELDNVTWAEAEGGYTATATYTRLATSRTATGYTATAEYTGTVYLAVPGPVTYTAIFEGTPESTEASEGIAEPVTDSQPEPEPAKKNNDRISFAIGMGLIALVTITAGVYVWKRQKG